jgi:hypothetical protein
MMPVLTLSLSVTCTLADLNRQQTYMLPLVSLTMPLNRWRQLKQDIRSVVSDIRQSVGVVVAIGEVIFKSTAWGVGWL